ncbi:MAG: eL32 family ribosomal protein [archaeon]
MAETTKNLELRNQAKKKKYTFVVKESKFSASVKNKWKFPRGKHSKVRQMHRGRPALPSLGYGSPKDVKGLHSSGLKFNVVTNITDTDGLDSKVDGVVISGNVGKRKKIELVTKVLEKGFTIINLKDAQKTVKDIQTEFEERKKQRKERLTDKEKKSEEKKKKAEEKKKKDEEEKKVEKEGGVEEKLEATEEKLVKENKPIESVEEKHVKKEEPKQEKAVEDKA